MIINKKPSEIIRKVFLLNCFASMDMSSNKIFQLYLGNSLSSSTKLAKHNIVHNKPFTPRYLIAIVIQPYNTHLSLFTGVSTLQSSNIGALLAELKRP